MARQHQCCAKYVIQTEDCSGWHSAHAYLTLIPLLQVQSTYRCAKHSSSSTRSRYIFQVLCTAFLASGIRVAEWVSAVSSGVIGACLWCMPSWQTGQPLGR